MHRPTAHSREGEEVMSAEDVCSYAKISYDTFQRYRKAGNGPPELRVGQAVRFLRSDVIQWLAEQRGAPES